MENINQKIIKNINNFSELDIILNENINNPDLRSKILYHAIFKISNIDSKRSLDYINKVKFTSRKHGVRQQVTL